MGDAEVIAEIRLFAQEDGEVVVVDGGGDLGIRKRKEKKRLHRCCGSKLESEWKCPPGWLLRAKDDNTE